MRFQQELTLHIEAQGAGLCVPGFAKAHDLPRKSMEAAPYSHSTCLHGLYLTRPRSAAVIY